MDKNDYDTLLHYLEKFNEDENLIWEINEKLACIYGIIIIYEKIENLNLIPNLDTSIIFLNEEKFPCNLDLTISKLKAKDIIDEDEDEDNNVYKNFVKICWQILTYNINDDPFNGKEKNKIKRKSIEKSLFDICDELDKIINGNELNILKSIIEDKFKNNNDILDKVKLVIDETDDNYNENNEIKEEESITITESEYDEIETKNLLNNENEYKNNSSDAYQTPILLDETNIEKLINEFEKNENIKSPENKEDEEFFNKYQNFFDERNFILTKESKKRLLLLRDFIKLKIPVLLEGPTGTSKTLCSEIICEILLKEENGEINENKLPIKFNLSSETRIPDLFGKYRGSKNSFTGMRMEDGPFIDAYKNGKILILDEINLSSKTVLQCIGEAIDNDYLSIDIPGRPLNKIKKKEGFSIIATQNPNSGFYEKKRQELGKDFLSRFQIIYFPSLTQSELEKIALGLGEKFKLKDNNLISKHELFIKDLVNFHIEWSNRNDIQNDIQCFTIREIAATIKALSPDEERDKNKTIDVDIYHTIMNIYGARYPKQKKNELEKIFKKYDSFKNLVPSKLNKPSGFVSSFFENKVIIEVINSVLFSLENQRHVIITGKEENGKTQIVKGISILE